MSYNVRGVAFSEKSEDEQFSNLKSEWHFKLRKWIIGGGKIKQDYGWNELEVVKYKNKDGKIIIQPKEDLFRDGIGSPNVVYAAVLTMAVNDQTVKSSKIMKQMGGRPFNDHMVEIWNGK